MKKEKETGQRRNMNYYHLMNSFFLGFVYKTRRSSRKVKIYHYKL